ncbi:MAG: class I SAM-dependent methyltransferase [Pseudomonadota bacterium]
MGDKRRESSQLMATYDKLRLSTAPVEHKSGYLSKRLFRKEQDWILQQLDQISSQAVIVDVGCGYGAMLDPVIGSAEKLIGVELHPVAAQHAHSQGMNVVCSDAFELPLATSSVDVIVNSQFLNQLDAPTSEQLLAEFARVLKPGGTLILTWRHASSIVHRLAQCALTLTRSRFADFPQYEHPWQDLNEYCADVGLKHQHCKVLRLFKTEPVDLSLGRVLGISCVAVLTRA